MGGFIAQLAKSALAQPTIASTPISPTGSWLRNVTNRVCINLIRASWNQTFERMNRIHTIKNVGAPLFIPSILLIMPKKFARKTAPAQMGEYSGVSYATVSRAVKRAEGQGGNVKRKA